MLNILYGKIKEQEDPDEDLKIIIKNAKSYDEITYLKKIANAFHYPIDLEDFSEE